APTCSGTSTGRSARPPFYTRGSVVGAAEAGVEVALAGGAAVAVPAAQVILVLVEAAASDHTLGAAAGAGRVLARAEVVVVLVVPVRDPLGDVAGETAHALRGLVVGRL